MPQPPLFEDAEPNTKPAAAGKESKFLLKSSKLVQPLKWHGGKHYLAKRIIELMPEHLHYVEPFFGGGSVLLNKDPQGVSEVVNDVHHELTNFWRTLQDEQRFAQFMRIVEAVPFSEIEWNDSREPAEAPDPRPDEADALADGPSEPADDAGIPTAVSVEQAVRFFIRCRQSRAGKLNAFATLSRNRTRRQMNEQASSWMNAVEGLPAIAQRMRRVVILCQDAVKVLKRQDGANTLFYLDPPYVHESRVTTADYDFEMNTEQHLKLLDAIRQCKGKVLLSGYPNELYDTQLKDWNVVDIQIDNKASSKKNKPQMIERLWMNY